MRPEQPEIARPADRVGRRLRDLVLAVARAVLVAVAGEQLVELGVGEADDRQVEVLGQQLLQLAGEQRLVPGAELGQLVVGQTVGPPLLLGQVVEHDHRRLGQPELRRPPGCGRARRSPRRRPPPAPAPSSRTAPSSRRSSRPGPPRASWRSAHRASGARAAIARCAPERSSGSCPIILSGGGVDSGGGFQRWIPLGRGGLLQGPGGSHPRKGARLCFIGRYQASRWIPEAGWLPKNSRLSLANWRAERSRIRSAPERNRTINGLAAAAVRGGPASGKRDLRKAKRPASLSAAGRNASQGCLSTMPRKKSTHFLALVVESLPLRKWRFCARTRPLSAVGPKAVVVGALEEVIDARLASGPRMQALLTAMSSLPKTYGPLDHRGGLRLHPALEPECLRRPLAVDHGHDGRVVVLSDLLRPCSPRHGALRRPV